MTARLMVLSFVTALSTIAHAEDAGQAFTLEGLQPSSPKLECALYVDTFGYDDHRRFYATVRTSFEPTNSLLMVASPKNRLAMISVDAVGRPDGRLLIQLPKWPSESALRTAKSYRLRQTDVHPKRGRACVMLHSAEDSE